MNKREKLKVTKREVLGKQVKKLRREGLLPANIYGADFESTAISLPLKDFKEVFSIAKETGLVDVELDSKTVPVLIKNVQYDPRTEEVVHADFHKVNLKEKISAKIPVEAVGEPKAVTDKIGLLEQPVSEIEVEALPTDLPEKIEVNVEALAAIDEQILVSDLKIPAGVEVLTDASQVVFKIGELITKEMEEQMAADAAATEEAAAATDEAAAEGEEGKTEGADEESGEKSEEVKAEESKEEAPKE
ncbi:MAG: 50S ribosomal protein L25 [Candidatus Levybacteria bacterium]|nr:50S ribosomal protein L25 [Candidatus Levybacteria bacterium]